MSGMVGVIADDCGRYSLFSYCLTSLAAPVNTQIRFAISSDRSIGRNNLVKQAFDAGAEWLWFVDDDHTFPPSTLQKLVGASDPDERPVVGALYCQRQAPFSPIAYSAKHKDGRYVPLFLPDLPPDDLVQVRALGTGGMLIHMSVFDKMIYPWFQHTTEQSEDLRFCDILDGLGVPVYVHTGVRLGHISPTAVHPTYHPVEGWQIGFSIADQFSLAIGIDPIKEEGEDGG